MDNDIKHKPDMLDRFGGMTIEQLPQESSQQLPALIPSEAYVGAQAVAVRRDLHEIKNEIAALATMAGPEWFYRFPVSTKGGGQKFITGPSIKLANDISRIYGNCDVDCRVLPYGEREWLFFARFIDLEKGYTLRRPWLQSKESATLGTKDTDRAQNIAFQIGVSKAIRNCVVNALQTFCDFALEEAQEAVVETVQKKLDHYKEKVQARLGELGVDLTRVEITLSRPLRRWKAQDVSRIIAEIRAVEDGFSTADEIWPKIAGAEAKADKPLKAVADRAKSIRKRAKASRGRKTPAKAENEPAGDSVAPEAEGQKTAKNPQKTVLAIRTAMFQTKDPDLLARIWTDDIEPYEWSEKDFKRLQDCYRERQALAS